ncbi:hypothetical protein BYT27DRAFT_7199230 [Phlegmacium glaucopus]|nr:hypothetical protein BYT27DRAFT_7199230 [Phlegmacium glaucopus]
MGSSLMLDKSPTLKQVFLRSFLTLYSKFQFAGSTQQHYLQAKQSLSHATLAVSLTGCSGDKKLYSSLCIIMNRLKVLAEYLVLWWLNG